MLKSCLWEYKYVIAHFCGYRCSIVQLLKFKLSPPFPSISVSHDDAVVIKSDYWFLNTALSIHELRQDGISCDMKHYPWRWASLWINFAYCRWVPVGVATVYACENRPVFDDPIEMALHINYSKDDFHLIDLTVESPFWEYYLKSGLLLNITTLSNGNKGEMCNYNIDCLVYLYFFW
jgi:hypothetical protein